MVMALLEEACSVREGVANAINGIEAEGLRTVDTILRKITEMGLLRNSPATPHRQRRRVEDERCSSIAVPVGGSVEEEEMIIAAVNHVVIVIAATTIDPTARIAIAGRGRGGKGVAVVDLDHVAKVVVIVVVVEVVMVVVVERGEEETTVIIVFIIEISEKKEKGVWVVLLEVVMRSTRSCYSNRRRKWRSSNDDVDDAAAVEVADRGAEVGMGVRQPNNEADVGAIPRIIIRVTTRESIFVVVIIGARQGNETAVEAIVDVGPIARVVEIAAVEEEVEVEIKEALAAEVADLTLMSPQTIIGVVVGATVPHDQSQVTAMVVVMVDNLNCHNMDNDPNHVPTNAIVVSSKMVHRILALAIEAATIIMNGGMLLGVEEMGGIEVTWLKILEEEVVVVMASLTMESATVIIMEA